MKRTAGISLMLLIFLSLCLITFSLLSLSGATADENLSQKTADRTTAYYEAVTQANGILDEIDTQLAATFKETVGDENAKEAYLAACEEITVAGAELVWSLEEENAGMLSYDVAMTDDQHLHVALSICWPEESTDTFYQITSWKVVSTQDWTRDTSQNLYRTGEND
ncbi:MAG: hypothetical protein LUD12_00200 [Lachnospiraceae bacterium]|nr:hypothetical protein [Lachnospiraceae bacterium]